MKRVRALPILILVLALSLIILSACGGNQDAPGDGAGEAASQDSDQGAGSQDAGSPDDDAADQGDAGQGVAGQAPDGFPLPVYTDWELMLDRVDGSTRILLFRYEGGRDPVLGQYAQDLSDMGLDVTIDGFRVIALGEVDGQPVDFQAAFQEGEGITRISMALKPAH